MGVTRTRVLKPQPQPHWNLGSSSAGSPGHYEPQITSAGFLGLVHREGRLLVGASVEITLARVSLW